jgi:ribosomal protein L22
VAEVASADETTRVEAETGAEEEATRSVSSSEATSQPPTESESPAESGPTPEAEPPTEIEPTAEDIEAEEAAADVVLEAEAEAEGEELEVEADAEADEPKAKKPKAAPRRRRKTAAAAEEPKPPAKPAPSRRRRQRDPGAPIPVVRAQAKYVRSSPRKARLVCDHIRGKTVEEARAILAHTPRAIARDWSKLLESAVANAEHNHEFVGEDLYVKAVHADDGPTIKRFRPRAMGRASRIRKRTSHLTILLTPKD